MKNLFDAMDNNEIIERINKLAPDTNAMWGKMTVAQMLAHSQTTIEVALGERKLKGGLIGFLFGKIAKRKLVKDEPFKRNLPTAPSFIVKNERSLLEFGLKEWEPGTTVADYILNNITEDELIDNTKLLEVIQTFKIWYDEGIDPTEKNFLYHENQQMSALVVSITEFPYEVSLGWKEHYDMPVPTRDDTYKEEVFSTVNYIKLRKIKKLISINQKDLEKTHSVEEQLSLLQTHKHLKDLEVEMTRQMGTVILR